MCQTDIVGAGRDQSLINPMVAEVTFVGDVPVVVIGDGIIGAFVDAGLAAGAQVVIHDDDAVIALADSFIRANVRAGGIIAVPAQVHLKTEFHFIIDQPGAILFNANKFDPVRRPILLLAGHLTGFAAPTQVVVYFNFELGHNVCLYPANDHEQQSAILRNGFDLNEKEVRQDLTG